MVGKLVGGLFLNTGTSPEDYLSLLIAQWLQSDPKEPDKSDDVFYDLAYTTTCFHCILLFKQTKPDTVREGSTRGMNTSRQELLWVIVGASYYKLSVL